MLGGANTNTCNYLTDKIKNLVCVILTKQQHPYMHRQHYLHGLLTLAVSYAQTHTCMTHMHMHIYTNGDMHTYIHIHTYIYIATYIHTCMYTYTYIYTHNCVYMCQCACTHTHTHTHTHIHTHTHACKHTHAYTHTYQSAMVIFTPVQNFMLYVQLL